MKIHRSIDWIAVMRLLLITTVICALAVTPVWAGKSNGNGSGDKILSETEAAMLSYMREEEKLARDVYLVMYDTWGAAIFSKIAKSEQKHMDTMKKKLDKYNLPDSADPAIGVFNDTFLQGKYYELVDKGTLSYIDGLYVGATIEEIDMIDIQHAIDVTTHIDVINAYQHLLEGSKNHLRAYVRALDSQGFTYAPQLISQELYDAIIGL